MKERQFFCSIVGQKSSAQYKIGFIHSLLVKAQAKIQFNEQKKLDKITQFVQKKKTIVLGHKGLLPKLGEALSCWRCYYVNYVKIAVGEGN